MFSVITLHNSSDKYFLLLSFLTLLTYIFCWHCLWSSERYYSNSFPPFFFFPAWNTRIHLTLRELQGFIWRHVNYKDLIDATWTTRIYLTTCENRWYDVGTLLHVPLVLLHGPTGTRHGKWLPEHYSAFRVVYDIPSSHATFRHRLAEHPFPMGSR